MATHHPEGTAIAFKKLVILRKSFVGAPVTGCKYYDTQFNGRDMGTIENKTLKYPCTTKHDDVGTVKIKQTDIRNTARVKYPNPALRLKHN